MAELQSNLSVTGSSRVNLNLHRRVAAGRLSYTEDGAMPLGVLL